MTSGRVRRRDDRGGITPMMVIAILALMLMLGAGVDGATLLRAERDATNAASDAGRAGAQFVSRPGALTGGGAGVMAAQAAEAAQGYLAASGASGTVTVLDPTHLRVEASITHPTRLLGMIGIDQVTGTGAATVRLAQGVGGEN